jgi:2-amino-4-hydroxy-6-hydroxymethyldihydropteridine diphosphokinase
LRPRSGSRLKGSVETLIKNRSAQAILILGSNIQPEIHLPQAVQELAKLFRIIKVSGVWESAAVGSTGPRFLNAGLLIETNLSPEMLKHQVLRPLEARLGRHRTSDKYAPRSIDIDLIAWGEEICDAHVWDFVHLAVPAAELRPDLQSKETNETLEGVVSRLKRTAQIHPRPDVDLYEQKIDCNDANEADAY